MTHRNVNLHPAAWRILSQARAAVNMIYIYYIIYMIYYGYSVIVCAKTLLLGPPGDMKWRYPGQAVYSQDINKVFGVLQVTFRMYCLNVLRVMLILVWTLLAQIGSWDTKARLKCDMSCINTYYYIHIGAH